MSAWWAVVPVKDPRRGKSRLTGALDDDARAGLVRTMATATVRALLDASDVAGVVVVSPAPDPLDVADPRVVLLPEPVAGVGAHDGEEGGRDIGRDAGGARPDAPTAGLDAAVTAGVEHVRATAPGAHVVVVLGDLPHLLPAEVDDVLRTAARVPRAHLPDAAGTGTTMLTATWPHRPHPRFGPGSSARHAGAGHVALDVPATSGARRDVDEPADLWPGAPLTA
ncbi:2-phospho-L-lactate guanylyltransferase [Cellulomonas iranensis]|uniref:2-phospho-L-lactate guanylyltransferase n=1 Tax=Cellulomonas iranensis TaxID=76862 RepID=UPI003D7DC795